MDSQKGLLFQRESPTLIIDYPYEDPQLIKNGDCQHKDVTGRSQENLGSQKSQKYQKSQKSQKVCSISNSVKEALFWVP